MSTLGLQEHRKSLVPPQAKAIKMARRKQSQGVLHNLILPKLIRNTESHHVSSSSNLPVISRPSETNLMKVNLRKTSDNPL